MAGVLTRRAVVGGLAGVTTMVASGSLGKDVIFEIEHMLPGEFSWRPELSPKGAVAVIVSLPEQRVHVYRNGIRIAVSTCSTGKTGHETPTGVFTILQKDKDHRSSTYNNAPMPNMNRLTWDGIALHAGNLPGYPASHGCVRLPMAFSRQLFDVTHVGTPVIVAGSATDSWDLVHPGLILGNSNDKAMAEAVAALDARSHPSDWTTDQDYPVHSILATGKDRRIVLIEDGMEILEEELTVIGDRPLGEHVMMLQAAANSGNLLWTGITHHADPLTPLLPEEAVLNRLRASANFSRELSDRLHPGMTLIVSDLAAHPDRRSGRDFTIMVGADLETPRPSLRPPHQQALDAIQTEEG